MLEKNITIISPFCPSCQKTVEKEQIFVDISNGNGNLCACSDEQLGNKEFIEVHSFFCGECVAPLRIDFEPIIDRFCCEPEAEPPPHIICQSEFEEIDVWADSLDLALKPDRLKYPCDIAMNVPQKYLEQIYTDYRPDIIICWKDGFHYACPGTRRFEYEDYSSLQDPQYDEKPYEHNHKASPWD